MRGENDSGLILVCFGVVVVVALGIAHFFDVPFMVGVKIVPYLVTLGALTAAVAWVGYLRWTWPLFLGGLWLTFLPVVDYKAGVTDDDFPLMPYVAWYGHGGWQTLIFFVILAMGYGIAKWRDDI